VASRAGRSRGGGAARPRQAQRKPPDGRLRLSQVLTTFGAGSLLDLVEHAVIVGGLDFWRPAEGGPDIHEPRLRQAVARVMEAQERHLSLDRPFRSPPAGKEEDPTNATGIQVYEFPQWFLCQNPDCRALTRATQLELRNKRRWHACAGAERKESQAVPIRFVVACPRGHVADVAWPWWAHSGEPCASPRLRLDESPTGDFSEIVVRCNSCGKGRDLMDLTLVQRAPACSGERPWLGPEGKEEGCDQRQRLMVRSATNTYFSQTMSALSIPERPTVRQAVESVWNVLQAVTTPQTLQTFRQIPMVKDALGNASDQDVLAAVDAIRAQRPEPAPELRTSEFLQFTSQEEEQPGQMPPDDPGVTFWARRFTPPDGHPPGIQRVVLARRLREVVTQVGFTRLEPVSADLQGGYDLGVQSAPLSLQRDWLPAVEIRGEGIFIELDEAALGRWEGRPEVRERVEKLEQGFDAWRRRTGSKMAFPGGRFYLLHSLSHLLMNALSLECGYPASAIRERLYCAPATSPRPMAAILLSTGTSGVEGTLGGLVEEGRRLGEHLRRALSDGRLCSSDPVCAQHRPADASERYLEGAACHGCLFVAECSCERFNHFLDRALVSAALGPAGAGFFDGLR
jgi:hypothetical protein